MTNPDGPLLVLVPTEKERSIIEPYWLSESLEQAEGRLEICGFGPVAAAANTMRLLTDVAPSKVLLIGIAGGFSEAVTVGQAYVFQEVVMHGIGVGSGSDFRPLAAFDPCRSLSLSVPAKVPHREMRQTLLTCCAASAGPDDVQWRKHQVPGISAEEMEGYAVAYACQLAKIPLTIIRGISNRVGDRDFRNWQMETALEAAVCLAHRTMR